MGYPLQHMERMFKDIANTYKEITPNDTVITMTEMERYQTYELMPTTTAENIMFTTTGISPEQSLSINPFTSDSLSSYGIQFIELMRKYGIGLSAQKYGTNTALTAGYGAPTDTYPSLSAAAGSGILLFVIPKQKYGAGIAPNTFALTGRLESEFRYYNLSTSVTSSVYGSNVEIFPNPSFRVPSGLTSTRLNAEPISGFLFNDEGILGLISSAPNDVNGYNPISAFAANWNLENSSPPATFKTIISFNSQYIMNTFNFACKTSPDELNFSFNPSAFASSSEGGSTMYGYNYVYKLPVSLSGDEESPGYSDDQTYDSLSAEIMGNLSGVGIQQNFQSYVTGIGLYNKENELLAVGKLGQPLKKSLTLPMTFKVSIDI